MGKRKAERKIAGILRVALVAVLIVLQVFLLFFLVGHLREGALYLYVAIEIIAVINIILMVGRSRGTSYTVTWTIVIILLPVSGYILYILWGRANGHGRKHAHTRECIAYGNTFLEKDPQVYARLGGEHPARKRIAGYLGRKDFPLYRNTRCQYYSLGERQFDAMLGDMERAEKFIFIEYFILNTGQLWDRMLDVITRKAAQGVEVRLMYDDLGSIFTAPDHLIAQLNARGIQVVRFNPIHRFVFQLYINYRNHQKITVIDGNIGYTGGTNIADEYINLYPKYGHWKDTAIRMEGDAVWSLTVTFLQMWDSETWGTSNFEAYRPAVSHPEAEGYFQPFADGPASNPDKPAETMYRRMVSGAVEYLYVTTPYLVTDDTMMDLLCGAAISGVDVRMILPKKPDRWYVHMVSRSNYGELLRAGVRIYEYTPGYIHAKTILSDDDHCITGSINMDYRSFNLHFENGVWICGAPVLAEIKQNILDTLALSKEVRLEEWTGRAIGVRMMESVLRLFAALM